MVRVLYNLKNTSQGKGVNKNEVYFEKCIKFSGSIFKGLMYEGNF